MLKVLRNAFFTGIILLLPLAVTIIIINFLLKNIGAPSSKLFFWFLDPSIRQLPWIDPIIDIVSTVVVVVLIALFGLLSQYFLGRLLVKATEMVMHSLPFINTVYKTVKQIVDTFSKEHRAVFQKVVLVEYPRPGVYAVGFLTSRSKGEVQEVTGEEVLNVFVPTTPNPTSGFLLMIPKEQVTILEMSIADGMKLIISGGALVPPFKKTEKSIEESTSSET